MRSILSAAAAAAVVVFAAAPALADMGCGSRAPAIIAHETKTPIKRAPVVTEVIVTPGVATVAGIRPAPVAPPALYVIEGDAVRSGS